MPWEIWRNDLSAVACLCLRACGSGRVTPCGSGRGDPTPASARGRLCCARAGERAGRGASPSSEWWQQLQHHLVSAWPCVVQPRAKGQCAWMGCAKCKREARAGSTLVSRTSSLCAVRSDLRKNSGTRPLCSCGCACCVLSVCCACPVPYSIHIRNRKLESQYSRPRSRRTSRNDPRAKSHLPTGTALPQSPVTSAGE